MQFSSFFFSNRGHGGQEMEHQGMIVLSYTDVILNLSLRSAPDNLISLNSASRGSIQPAGNYLRGRLPNLALSPDTVPYALCCVIQADDDAEKLLEFVRSQNETGNVDYFDYILDDETGVRSTLIWSFAESVEGMKRYGTLLWRYSTNNPTQLPRPNVFVWHGTSPLNALYRR